MVVAPELVAGGLETEVLAVDGDFVGPGGRWRVVSVERRAVIKIIGYLLPRVGGASWSAAVANRPWYILN